ncbi:MAG TPA: hypothetical protein VN437_08625, partial [Rectinemataceae bacterium]|nr:hypothetical protein [Rectinemataceae bacterium]
WSVDRYDDYMSGEKGTLKIVLNKFHNRNVGDNGSTAEWLWKVKLLPSTDNTSHILAARTTTDESKEVGKRSYYSFNDPSVTLSDIPLASSTTFSITPMLEEDDGSDLGVTNSNNDPNDLYCTDTSGPHFNFSVSNGKIIFTGVDTPKDKAKGYFALSSGGLSNDALSLQIGDKDNPNSQRFFLVLKQFDDTNSDEWVEFVLILYWEKN